MEPKGWNLWGTPLAEIYRSAVRNGGVGEERLDAPWPTSRESSNGS